MIHYAFYETLPLCGADSEVASPPLANEYRSNFVHARTSNHLYRCVLVFEILLSPTLLCTVFNDIFLNKIVGRNLPVHWLLVCDNMKRGDTNHFIGTTASRDTNHYVPFCRSE
jgi:hypothetical protein